MKAINKAQVIDLMKAICKDGMDNSCYSVDVFFTETNACEFYGGDAIEFYGAHSKDVAQPILLPGTYCALWFNEDDLSDFPSVSKCLDEDSLSESIDALMIYDFKGWLVLVCMDLL